MVDRMAERRYRLFVPCAVPYAKPASARWSIGWLDGKEAAGCLNENTPGDESQRHAGGFLIEVQSRDPWSAVEAAHRIIARADATS